MDWSKSSEFFLHWTVRQPPWHEKSKWLEYPASITKKDCQWVTGQDINNHQKRYINNHIYQYINQWQSPTRTASGLQVRILTILTITREREISITKYITYYLYIIYIKYLFLVIQVLHSRSVSSPANLLQSLTIKTTPQHSKQSSFDGFLDSAQSPAEVMGNQQQQSVWPEASLKYPRYRWDILYCCRR